MKHSLYLRILPLLLMLSFYAPDTTAADYYVVIGTFEEESSARKLAGSVKTIFKDVSYSFEEDRGLYLVYVMKTDRKEDARNWSLFLRHEKGFRQAWVLADPEDESIDVPDIFKRAMKRNAEVQLRSEVTPANTQTVSPVAGPQASISVREAAPVANSRTSTLRDESTTSLAWVEKRNISFARNISGVEALPAREREETRVMSFIVEDPAGKALDVEVMLVDFEKIKKLAAFRPGENIALRGAERNQMVAFVCDVLGYKQETRMFNIDHLSRGRDVSKNDQGIWEVRIKLRKMDVDDLSYMNSTTFYKDATVLEPGSQKEMDDLVALLQLNPGYHIIIHTHCNPAGKRTLRFVSGKKFFDLENAAKGSGSDKKLTKKRAETIMHYLVARGIDKKRLGIMGWGSIDQIVKNSAPDARINDRVEIELVAK